MLQLIELKSNRVVYVPRGWLSLAHPALTHRRMFVKHVAKVAVKIREWHVRVTDTISNVTWKIVHADLTQATNKLELNSLYRLLNSKSAKNGGMVRSEVGSLTVCTRLNMSKRSRSFLLPELPLSYDVSLLQPRERSFIFEMKTRVTSNNNTVLVINYDNNNEDFYCALSPATAEAKRAYKKIRSKQQSTKTQKMHAHAKTSLEHYTCIIWMIHYQQHTCQPHTSNNSTHTCTNMRIHTDTHTDIETHTHRNTHTHSHTHTHPRARTHTHTHTLLKKDWKFVEKAQISHFVHLTWWRPVHTVEGDVLLV